MDRKLIPACIVGAFSFSTVAIGVGSPIGVLTISSLSLVFGVLLTIYSRISSGRPVLPKSFLSIPIVYLSIAYFAWGVMSGVVAADKLQWFKEVIQRTTLILLPLYLFSMGPKTPKQIQRALFVMLPFGVLLVGFAVKAAKAVGFAKPVYVLGMHKNQIAGTCAVIGVMAIACLLTSSSWKKRLGFGAVLLVGILGCVATQGRAGLICMVVSTVFMLIAVRAKPKNILYFALSIGLAGFTLISVMPKEAIEHAVTTKKFSSNGARVDLWSTVVPELEAHPLDMTGWGQTKYIGTQLMYDVANVFLFDWMQVGPIGALLLLGMIGSSVQLALENASRLPTNSLLSFINLVSLGVITTRFFHGMLDTFWIGRGINLTTWMAIGICVFVRLMLDQNKQGRYRQTDVVSASKAVAAR